MQLENNGRSEFLDFVKGFAIFCVVWGHTIQFFVGVLRFLD